MPSEITVYEAHQRRKTGLFAAVCIMTVDVVRCRELIWQLQAGFVSKPGITVLPGGIEQRHSFDRRAGLAHTKTVF